MRILAIDLGTGTQDILLFDSTQPVENALQLIMPSPTQIAAGRIRRATEQRRAVWLTGVIAGGGPSHWALEDHLRTGLSAYATREAATTFDDDLENVESMGVTLVSDDESTSLDADQVRLRDLDLDAVRTALAAFDVDTRFDGLALGCLDHGAAPPGYSDRLFRFDHLRHIVEQSNDLRAFAYLPHELPDYLTRARTLVACADAGVPTVFLDTGPAAALGALQDPHVSCSDTQLILNLGNMHALAFHLRGTQIISLYEHHTGELTREQIEDFTERLIAGELPHEDVFDSKGHGVYYANSPLATRHSQRDRPAPHSAAPEPHSQLITATGPQQSRHSEPRGARGVGLEGEESRRSAPAPHSAAPEPHSQLSTLNSQPVIAVTGPQQTRHSEPRGARGVGLEGEESRRSAPAPHSAAPEPHSQLSTLDSQLVIAVTGPQRGKLRPSRLNPYFAVPHGDMMVSGCFGLLWAFAEKHPDAHEGVLSALGVEEVASARKT